MQTNQHGFTLIETIIFIIIVGVAMGAIVVQFTTSVQHSAAPLLRQKAITIAYQYLDHMQTVRWDETTPVGGGTAPGQSTPGLDAAESCTLSQLDDFDDFDCFNNTALTDGFSINIDVFNGSSSWDSIPSNAHKKAEISVATPVGETLTVTLFRANY